MPNKINLEFPPASIQTENRELFSYMYRTIEQLNVCLSSIDSEQISGAIAGTLSSIRGLENYITQMGSSTSMALVSALKRVSEESATMDLTLRTFIGNSIAEYAEDVDDQFDNVRRIVEDIAAGLSAYKLEIDAEIRSIQEVQTSLNEEIIALDTDLSGRIESLDQRVSALEGPNDV